MTCRPAKPRSWRDHIPCEDQTPRIIISLVISLKEASKDERRMELTKDGEKANLLVSNSIKTRGAPSRENSRLSALAINALVDYLSFRFCLKPPINRKNKVDSVVN